MQWWRHRADLLSAAVDRVCEEINEAADLATEYWLIDEPTSGDVNSLEARLVGRQLRLQQLITALESHTLQFPTPTTVGPLLVDLYDAMTGGEFRVQRRAQDLDRAQLVQAKAAELNGELRQAIAKRFRPWR